MQTHTVLIVEDDENTRTRLASIVSAHPQLTVTAAVGTCLEAQAELKKGFPDVLLSDLGLPDGNGLDLIRFVTTHHPQTESMVITVFGDEKNVLAAIEAGASGYLLKDGNSEYIGQSIMQMLAGGSPISASIARFLLKRFKSASTEPTPSPDPRPALTAREQAVLELVAKGFSYVEIAKTLDMSVHTVTSHIKHIYRKLAVNSRSEAVFEAMQLGIIKLTQ
jgi:DNA-binding NarL/FixJ family response regulator